MTAGQIISLLTATISKYPLFSRDVGPLDLTLLQFVHHPTLMTKIKNIIIYLLSTLVATFSPKLRVSCLNCNQFTLKIGYMEFVSQKHFGLI